ncbi:hypothetical protein SDC9_197948 [bioreactor metagenome]|uniref:Uncharacterized protein n=1 Tax=bioreactor metagenome TaxID=1076179 RepID=A0A645IHK7_9ZZZZ
MHPYAGRGVYLHHHAPLLPHGAGNVGRDYIHARNVDAHRSRREHGQLGVVGVNQVGTVHGGSAGAEVAVLPKEDMPALGGDAVRRQAIFG